MVRRIGAVAAACALTLTAIAGVAWAAQAGTYSGSTSQHAGTISLKVSGGKVIHVTFADGTGHGSGCSQFAAAQPQFPVSFKAHMAIARNGTFSGTASPRDQEVFKLSGRVSAGKITGSFTDRIPIGQLTSKPITCSSGTVRFTARRASHAAAAAAAAAAHSVRPKAGYYLGYSGAYSLSFAVPAHGAKVTGLTTDFQANSDNGGCMPAPQEIHVAFASMAITGGAFRGTAHPSSATPATDAIRGHFTSATTVRGTIGESYTITSLPPCRDTQAFAAQYVGPSKASAASVLILSGGGQKATFTNVSAQFGNLVEPTGTPKLHTAGTAFIMFPARHLTNAQSAALKGPITSMRLHLVVAGSPFVNATYAFSGAHETRISSINPGTFQITLSYANVRRAP